MVAVTARDVMSREFVGVSEGDLVDDVLELMVDQAVDDVLVLRGSEPVGVVSCHDVLDAVASDGDLDGQTAEQLMQPAPDPVAAEEDLGTVLSRLASDGVETLPVADDEQALVGVVTDDDVIAAATSLVSEPNGMDSVPATDAVDAAEQTSLDASTPATAPAATGSPTAASPEHSTQGVCESCSTLTGDLQVVNGQSICPECRDV